jgi:hypothetical protein
VKESHACPDYPPETASTKTAVANYCVVTASGGDVLEELDDLPVGELRGRCEDDEADQ